MDMQPASPVQERMATCMAHARCMGRPACADGAVGGGQQRRALPAVPRGHADGARRRRAVPARRPTPGPAHGGPHAGGHPVRGVPSLLPSRKRLRRASAHVVCALAHVHARSACSSACSDFLHTPVLWIILLLARVPGAAGGCRRHRGWWQCAASSTPPGMHRIRWMCVCMRAGSGWQTCWRRTRCAVAWGSRALLWVIPNSAAFPPWRCAARPAVPCKWLSD